MVKSGIDYAKLRNSGKQVVFEISNVTDLDMNDIKKLKLVPQCYNNEQMDFIKESEEGFTPQANQEGTKA